MANRRLVLTKTTIPPLASGLELKILKSFDLEEFAAEMLNATPHVHRCDPLFCI